MSEIADLTYNVVAFSEIMSMVWKRLNDHGKNWRHVYKVRVYVYGVKRSQYHNVQCIDTLTYGCVCVSFYLYFLPSYFTAKLNLN